MKRDPLSEEARSRYRSLWEAGHSALRSALKGGMSAEVYGRDLVQKPDGVSDRQVYNIAGEVTPFVLANLGPLSVYSPEEFRTVVEQLARYLGMELVPASRPVSDAEVLDVLADCTESGADIISRLVRIVRDRRVDPQERHELRQCIPVWIRVLQLALSRVEAEPERPKLKAVQG